jgi:hypothetical protein
MQSNIILKGFEQFPNFRVSELPEVITPGSLKRALPASICNHNASVHDADGKECKYIFELNRLTGEAKRFSENEDGTPFAILGVAVTEHVTLKMPITITLI